MRKFILAALTVTLMGICSVTQSMVFASSHPVRTLHDLPSRWEGFAGDMFSKNPARLNIEKIHRVVREDRTDGYSAVYDVTAMMTLGSRVLKIKQVTLSQYSFAANAYQLIFSVEDDFVTALVASVVYDEASNTFTLRELVENGMRRFIFQAVAKH